MPAARSLDDVRRVIQLKEGGHTDRQISRLTGIRLPRSELGAITTYPAVPSER
jgi:hypothetical protein